jgi:uncharacterized membrane protein
MIKNINKINKYACCRRKLLNVKNKCEILNKNIGKLGLVLANRKIGKKIKKILNEILIFCANMIFVIFFCFIIAKN